MRFVRRHDLAPRVEMTPLIDVIFLLLTFFIYSLVMMVQARVLPVELSRLQTSHTAHPGPIQAITIDAAGRLYLNRRPISGKRLDTKLDAMADQHPPPKLFLAMQTRPGASRGVPHTAGPAKPTDRARTVDRGPLLIHLIERVRKAGITNFNIVGQPPARRSR